MSWTTGTTPIIPVYGPGDDGVPPQAFRGPAALTLSTHQHSDRVTFETGCDDIRLAVLVDVPDGQVERAWSRTERRAGCRRKRPAVAKQHDDGVARRDEQIGPLVAIGIGLNDRERLASDFVRRLSSRREAPLRLMRRLPSRYMP